jgi:hypothetical protein
LSGTFLKFSKNKEDASFNDIMMMW